MSFMSSYGQTNQVCPTQLVLQTVSFKKSVCICLEICLCLACNLVRLSGQNARVHPKNTILRTLFEKMLSPLRRMYFDRLSRVPAETILLQTADIV